LENRLVIQFQTYDTIRIALEYLRRNGRCRNGIPSKTVIFTENHAHSEAVYREWAKLFPEDPPHFCRVIDSSQNYVRTLVDDFIRTDGMPQIAVSHDLLFDGVDMPAVENLVFFTRAASGATFWRMLGRGMRRCRDLPDGKPTFFVLDLCDNFRTFRSGSLPCEDEPLPVHARNFAARVRIAAELQSLSPREGDAALRESLVKALHREIRALDTGSFSVQRHLAAIAPFLDPAAFTALSTRDVAVLCRDIAPLIATDGTEERTALFNEQMYTILLARLEKKPYDETRAAILRTVRTLAQMGTHRKVALQKKTLNRILFNKYLDQASSLELETARRALEGLIRYLPAESETPIRTHFTDRILSETPLGEAEKESP
jgi:type I site-specific restriction endonuclease